jgi:phospholipase A1
MPVASVAQGDTALFDVISVDATARRLLSPLRNELFGTITMGSRSWRVVLRALPSQNTSDRLPASGIASRRYAVELPNEALGIAFLTIHGLSHDAVRCAVEIQARASWQTGPSPAEVPVAKADTFQAERTFSNRLGIHEPLYIIAGSKQPKGKIQLSFKYRLITFGQQESVDAIHTLQLGYTQRSLWHVLGPEPQHFYDTDYMPELFYQWLPTTVDPSNRQFSVDILQSGFRHESNGEGNSDERSLNLVYVQLGVSIGSAAGWHALVAPEVYEYLGNLGDNPDIKRYLGYGQLRMTAGKGNGPSLTFTLIPGEHFKYGSRELDLSIPLRLPFSVFGFYALVQYFDGFGESLLSYNQHTSQLRAGIEFVR